MNRAGRPGAVFYGLFLSALIAVIVAIVLKLGTIVVSGLWSGTIQIEAPTGTVIGLQEEDPINAPDVPVEPPRGHSSNIAIGPHMLEQQTEE